MYNLGYVDKIEDVIKRRRNKVDMELYFDVEPDPSIDTVNEGVELMRKFHHTADRLFFDRCPV